MDDGEKYTITGYVPALLNGQRVKLILIFDNDNPYGYVAGADPDYSSDETDTVSRGLIELEDGDRLRFLCDFYSYEGVFDDSHYLGEEMTVDTSKLEISNTDITGGDGIKALYKFTDIYNQAYWTDVIEYPGN